MLLVPMATPREPKAMSFWRDEQLVRNPQPMCCLKEGHQTF